MPAPSVYNNWLPAPIVREAKEKEPKRFAGAVVAFKRAVDAAKADVDNPNAWAAVLAGQLLDDLKTLISTKTAFAASDISAFVYALYDVVLLTSSDVEVQVRCCEVLNHVLRHHRHSQYLGLQLPWRPLYGMLQGLYDKPKPQLRGTFLDHIQHSTLFQLVARSRRFFAPGAAEEIWTLLRPALVYGDLMATSTHLALGWLVLFFPTKQLPQTKAAVVQTWVAEWLGVWGRLVNCAYWDTHWLYLVARAVKDDWQGVVDWQPYIPELYTHMLACFKVPVGTATAGCPSAINPPHRALMLFGNKLDQVDDQPKSAAKLALHLLKQPQQHGGSNASAAAAEAGGTSTFRQQPSLGAEAAGSLESALSLGLGPAGAGSGVNVQGILHSKTHRASNITSGQTGSIGLSSSSSGGNQGLNADPNANGSSWAAYASADPAGENVPMSAAVAASADALDSLVQLLEQYCHPSNTGGWSGDLAVFLRHGVHYFMKILGRQCGTAGWPGEQVIVTAAAKRYVRAAVKLAARGQYSKRESLVSASCKALCHLSYVWPGAVLPLVLGRFQSALATATAMHQLPTSISSLALCVRPLLLAAWHTADESTQQIIAEAMMALLPGIDANDEAKTAAVFQFYTAVLSSIPTLHGLSDEQDEHSPLPTALSHDSADAGDALVTDMDVAEGGSGNGSSSSSARPTAAVYRLPLYLEDWVDQVMERLFTLLGNLDTGPGHRGTDQQAKPELLLQSTYLGKDTMYHSFFQHLMVRLPPRLADHVVSLLGQFATGTSLATVALEASSMFRAASIARPQAALEKLIKPLIAKVKREMPEPGTRSLTRSQEDALTWQLVLLGSCLGGLTPALLEPLVPQLEALVDDTLKLPSRVAANFATMVLSSTLSALSGWYVADQAWSQQGGLLLPNGLRLWIDRQGVGWQPPRWELPSDSQVATAARLADKYMEDAAKQLTQLCNGSNAASAAASRASDSGFLAFKTSCRGLLASMAAVIIGLMSRLRDFDEFSPQADSGNINGGGSDNNGLCIQVVGSCTSPIGAPGVRNRAAAALAAAINHLKGGDRELLEQASYTSLLLMCPGMLEQALGGQGRHGGKDDGAIIDEPAAATAYLLAWSSRSSTSRHVGQGSSPKKGHISKRPQWQALQGQASGIINDAADGGFMKAFTQAEQQAHQEVAAEIAAMDGASGSSVDSSKPGAGSWGNEWRWRRRTSPLAVFDRLRRMLLWRCAQAAAKAGPGASQSTAAVAAANPAAVVTLQQLPKEYVNLFMELMVLAMQPNAAVRGSAMPTLQSCVKRFPCLVELMLPDMLAALGGVPGPLLGGSSSKGEASAAAAAGDQSAADRVLPLNQNELQRFYGVTLMEAMDKQQTADAAASGSAEAGAQTAGQPQRAAAVLAAAAKAAISAAAVAGKTDGSKSSQAAKAAAAAAAMSAAAAGVAPQQLHGGGNSSSGGSASSTATGGRTVAQESENDGRVAGACAVLAGCLEAWRVIFRDPVVFRGFIASLMASRCHSSNMCLKSIQMLIMQVISRFKLPSLLSVDSDEYKQLQTSLMGMAEPGARVTWRYAVLSNMILMFAGPAPGSAASLVLLQHCLGLMRSDMVLLRRIGGAGLWLMLTQVAETQQHGASSGSSNGIQQLVDELKQAMSDEGIGETMVKLLVLDHAKLDASEAAKAARDGGGGGGGGQGGLAMLSGGVLSGLLGMTAEEVMGAMVAAAVERFDRWPSEGGRPTATTDGLFEVSHARLVRLLATLCPQQMLSALQTPLTTRLQQHSAPVGPSEKAELAAVAEVLAGLLAAAAPAVGNTVSTGSTSSSTAGNMSGAWAIDLLKEGLASTTLETSDAWCAALWYIIDHLLMTVMPADSSRSKHGKGNSSNSGIGGPDAMDLETLDTSGVAAASPAAAMLKHVLDAVMHALPGTAATITPRAADAAAASSGSSTPAAAAARPALPGSGAATPGALPSDLKRLKYLLSCLPPIRRLGTLGCGELEQMLAAAPASKHWQDNAGAQAALPATPPSAAQQNSGGDKAAAAAAAAVVAAGRQATVQVPDLPKPIRVFLAALMHELQGLVEMEQATAVREASGALLADVAGLFATPAPIKLPATAATGASGTASADAAAGVGSKGDDGSGCSSPVEIEVPKTSQGGEGDDAMGVDVVVLNSSIAGLRVQAAALLQQTVSQFAAHAARLESLKNSGSGGAASSNSSNNLAAAGGSSGRHSHKSSNNSDDVVMVDASEAAAGTAVAGEVAANGSSSTVQWPNPANPASLTQSLTPCSLGLQLIIACFEGGVSGSLRPLLAALLPGVLALQELSGPGLQQLAGEAKSAFVLYKYLPFAAGQVPSATRSILAAGSSEAWSSRAAGMVFLQCFWFRHCYLLDVQAMEQLQAFVVGRLQDPKVEVRSLAAATLSGIIKALPVHEIDTLRGQLVSQVHLLFSSQTGAAAKRHNAAVAGAAGQQQQGAAFLAEAQAVVQGLKAFVLSSPYDVPSWMPEVLMALMAAANSRNPLVRRDASKALSEFKRTHEEDALEQLRVMLREEQWEALTQVTSSATYFV